MMVPFCSEHPRVRGENLPVVCPPQGPPGTSPRARGKPPRHPCAGGNRWNIPACAGKTPSKIFFRFRCSEHPRVRGENFFCDSFYVIVFGTSPRARGKLLHAFCML